MKNAKQSGADIWYADSGELERGPILNYDRNDDKHDYKNNYHNNDIDHYEINHDYHDYNNNYNNDKSSETETKRQRNILEVLAFYFQR